jgi:hypothetical protein
MSSEEKQTRDVEAAANTQVRQVKTSKQPAHGAYRGCGGRRPGSTPRQATPKNEARQISQQFPRLPPGTKVEPKALATTATPLCNDPMWIECEDHGFAGLTPYRAENEFATSFEGFIPLLDREYDLIGSADRTFTKFISRSMWNYYCTQHLYSRIIAICKHVGEARLCDERFPDTLHLENYPVPSSIDQYLRSVGDTTNSQSIRYRLKTPAWPNKVGHFGQVGPETHWKYENMPAPVVLVTQIQEDIRQTRNPRADPQWNLPEEIRPEEVGCGLPTANLLGWRRATRLTTEQLSALEGAGITEDDFPVNNAQFQMSRLLFEMIADKVRMLAKTIKLVAACHQNPNGSIAQTVWQTRDVMVKQSFDRTRKYCEYEVSVRSNSQQYKWVVNGSMICSFRVRKDTIGRRRPWCCYDFRNYLNVPDAWNATRNTIFEFGHVEQLNLQEFQSAFTGKDSIRTSWQRNDL